MTCGTGFGSFPLPGDPDLNSVVLTAQTVLNGVALSWTYPAVLGYGVAHTIIYRSTANVFAGAAQHKIIGGNYFFDPVIPVTATTYYYWIRLVSMQGTVGDPIGPASALVGAGAASMLDLFTDSILESALSAALRAKIATIFSVEGGLAAEAAYRAAGEDAMADLYASLSDDMAGLNTFLGAEVIARTNADSALVASVNLAYAMYNDNAGAILAEQLVRANADGAMASDIINMEARLLVEVDPEDLLPVSPGAAYATYAALNSAVSAAAADKRKYYRVVDPAAALEEVLYRSNGTTWSLIGTEQYAQLEQVMRVTASKATGLESQYTLKVSAGNAIAGIGLAATDFDGTPTSAFIVQADKFALLAASDYIQDSTPTATTVGETWYKPSTQQDFRSTAAGTGGWELYAPIIPFGVDAVTGTAYVSNSLRIGAGGTALSTVAGEASEGASAYASVIHGTTGLATKMGLAVQNVLAGEGGLKIGTIDWDVDGVVAAGGYGVAITSKGIVGRSSVTGADTFVLDATTGKATFKDDIETAGRVIATGGETHAGVLAAMHAIAGAVGGVGLYGSSGLYGSAGVDGNTGVHVGVRGEATATGGTAILAVATGGATALTVNGPMTINNSIKVDLLNADFLDGYTYADLAPLIHTHWIDSIYQSSGATDGSDAHVAKFQYSTVDPHTGPWTNFYLRRVNW